jgi:hypothetical protein
MYLQHDPFEHNHQSRLIDETFPQIHVCTLYYSDEQQNPLYRQVLDHAAFFRAFNSRSLRLPTSSLPRFLPRLSAR